MIKEYNKVQRIAHEIQKSISIILQHKIKDPRLNMITVSKLDVSRDLSYAKVFVTFLDNNLKEISKNIKVLQNAAGFIRIMLGKIMHLRIIPELIFLHDVSLIEGLQLSNLINKIVKENI